MTSLSEQGTSKLPASGSLQVREGVTGILTWTDDAQNNGTYFPDCRPEPALELLANFQALVTATGRPLRDCFHVDGINWFPTAINFLYWHVFRSVIKYRELTESVVSGRLKVTAGAGQFGILMRLLDDDSQRHPARLAAFSAAVTLNNLFALERKTDLLVFRSRPGDFRTAAASRALRELKVDWIESVVGERATLFSRDETGGRRYLTGWASATKVFDDQIVSRTGDQFVDRIFDVALKAITRLLSASVLEYRSHLRLLKRAPFRTMYSIDMTEGLYPLLYACQDRGITAIAHQHGACFNTRHPSYIMSGYTPGDYRWFDKLITWGEFWREQLRMLTTAYPAERMVVGCDLFEWPHEDHAPKRSPGRNVLVPYEFLTNSREVGRYITLLDSLGYVVFFKIRPDEPAGDQLGAYCLAPEVAARMKAVESFSPEVMESIDIVAGTCSTVLYQLLPWRRPTWIFNIDYRYSDDLVAAGQAHLVGFDELRNADPRIFTPPTIEVARLFGAASLKETLARYVIPGSVRS